jgi:hypothetical protein
MLISTRLRVGLCAVAVTVTVAGCSGSSGSPTARSTTATAVNATAGPVATTAAKPKKTKTKVQTSAGPTMLSSTDKPSVAISTAPAVKVGEPVDIKSDVQISIGGIKDVTVKARQPGEIAGPAAAVSVKVKNTSGKPFSLGGMVVTVSYHDGVPGDQTTAAPSKVLTGSLAVGKSAKGTYVFNVPSEYAATLHVEVSSDQSPTIVQFER